MNSPQLSELEDEAWQGFLYTHERLWTQIEAGLSPLAISMAEYSVLSLLGQAGRQGMRMSDIAKQRLMTSGGFTRLADRLERRGFIERHRAEDDKRGFVATLTAEGRSALRTAWRQQHEDLRRLFFDRLDDDDLRALNGIWEKLGTSEEE